MERRQGIEDERGFFQKIKPIAQGAFKHLVNYAAQKIITCGTLYCCCGKTVEQLVSESIEYKVVSYGREKAFHIMTPSVVTACVMCTVGCACTLCCIQGYRNYHRNDPCSLSTMEYVHSDKKNK
jgi:hypothetical protein